jgi:hemolysin D
MATVPAKPAAARGRRLWRAARPSDELEFLPAALEIVETPPSPVSRAVMLSLTALLVVALAWSIIGEVDIIATAPGRVIPSGKTKVVQPFEPGVVRAIHVQDGMRVRRGQVLVELDSTATQADYDRAAAELLQAQLDQARLQALLRGVPPERFAPPYAARPVEIETQRAMMAAQAEEQESKLAAIDRQLQQKQAELAGVHAMIAKLDATMPLVGERANARRYLYEKEYGSKLTYLEVQQQYVEQQQDRIVQTHRLGEITASIAALEKQRAQTQAEYRRTLTGDLLKAEQQIASLSQESVKAAQRTVLQTLTAPIDGTVQQLDIHTVGGVVTAAQPLMVVVPLDMGLEIQATVENKDIGFVRPDQDVEIKVETFNFTRYGLLHGRVRQVARDAQLVDDPVQGAAAAAGGSGDRKKAAADQSSGRTSGYVAYVTIDQPWVDVETGRVELTPGMSVTAEIKTGKRRVISYLLSPLQRYKQETARER